MTDEILISAERLRFDELRTVNLIETYKKLPQNLLPMFSHLSST